MQWLLLLFLGAQTEPELNMEEKKKQLHLLPGDCKFHKIHALVHPLKGYLLLLWLTTQQHGICQKRQNKEILLKSSFQQLHVSDSWHISLRAENPQGTQVL